MNERAGGLGTPIAVMRNMDWTHRVRLNTMTVGGRKGSGLRTHEENLCTPKEIGKFASALFGRARQTRRQPGRQTRAATSVANDALARTLQKTFRERPRTDQPASAPTWRTG